MKRHPLLIVRRRIAGWRLPALLITLGCAALWWFAPDLFPAEALDLASSALLTGAVAGALLSLYAWGAPRLAYVECRPDYLLISAPFFRLALSYNRIRNVRPVRFVAPAASGLRRDLVAPFLGQTAVMVDLKSYPLGERWLRLWLGWFMFPPVAVGLQFVTPDWMVFSRDLDERRTAWKLRRLGR